MQVASLVLICLVCAYQSVAQKREAEALASLLASHSPEVAAISDFYNRYTRSPRPTIVYDGREGSRDGLGSFQRGRSRPFKFEVNGVDVEVPVKLESTRYGGKLLTGFNFTANGIKFSFPFTFIFREFWRRGFRRGSGYDSIDDDYDYADGYTWMTPFRPGRYISHTLRKAKAELDRPLEFDANGRQVKVPVIYEAGELKYPVKWNTTGGTWEFAVPFKYSLAGGFTLPTMSLYDTTLPKVSGRLLRKWRFYALRYHEFEVPLEFDGERLTSGLETTWRGVRLSLPVRLVFRGLRRLNERRIARWFRRTLSWRNLKGELKQPIKLGRRSVRTGRSPLTLPIAMEHGQVVFPFNITRRGWNFSFPFSWKFANHPYYYDDRTLADFNGRDIYGNVGWLGQYMGKVVLVAVISNVEECAELHELQKKNRDDLQVIAVVSNWRLMEEIKIFEETSDYRTGSIVKGRFYPSGLVILDDQDTPLFDWLRDQKRGLPFNFGNDKFLLNRAGKPVARFGPLSVGKSYEDTIAELI